MKGAAERWSHITVQDKQVEFVCFLIEKSIYKFVKSCRNMKIFIKKKNKNMLKL
jgi:hypothetical protein